MKKSGKKSRKKFHAPRTRLRLPDLDQGKAAVLLSLRSPESQGVYRHAIDEFIGWCCSECRSHEQDYYLFFRSSPII
jgi:hypothetical protein